MMVQLANGLISWKKWERHNVYDVPGAKDLADAAYKAVRMSHSFLSDTNHTHESGPKTVEWGGQTLHFNSVTIWQVGGVRRRLGPPLLQTDYWFAVEYREWPPTE